MKKQAHNIFFLIMVPFSHIAYSQNLVPNPSFEEYTECKYGLGGVSKAIGWTQINSADYFNVCDTTSSGGVPNNFLGYQCPSSGSAYCGFYLFAEWWPPGVEFIQGYLTTTTITGQRYYVNFKVNMANGSNCGINKIGMTFTNVFYGDTNIDYNSSNFAHIYSSIIITDTANWVSIKGSFIADSAYQYILIGNFFDTSNVNSTCYTPANKFSFYYIDDICVSLDSLTCEQNIDSNICDSISGNYETPLYNQLKIYPNPFYSTITIEFDDYNYYEIKNTTIELYDVFQRKIKTEFSPNSNKIQINLQKEELSSGVYFLKIKNYKEIIATKIIHIQ